MNTRICTVAQKGHAGCFCFPYFHNRFFGCLVSVVQLNESARNVSTAWERFRCGGNLL